MQLTPTQMETVRHQFDSFCRKVMRRERRNYLKQIETRSEREIAFSTLSDNQKNLLYLLDSYPIEQFHFQVQGYEIVVHDERIASGLEILSDEKKEIILLAYFLDMTDQEIANQMNAIRGTIQYRRTKALKEMKYKLEDKHDGRKSKQ